MRSFDISYDLDTPVHCKQTNLLLPNVSPFSLIGLACQQ